MNRNSDDIRWWQLTVAAAVGLITLAAVLVVPREWVKYFTLAGMIAVMVVLFAIGAGIAIISGMKSKKRKRGGENE